MGALAKGEAPFVIAPTGQKIRYLKFEHIVAFIDTLQFVGASLEKLVSVHKEGNGEFGCLRQHFGEQAHLLERKGIFPYSFIDSWEAYDYDGLQAKSTFKNDLTDTECSDEDYQYALNLIALHLKIIQIYTY